MIEERPPTAWLATPFVAFTGTVVGVAALFLVQARLVPSMAGGYVSLCGAPDCGLGIGVMLIAAGFAMLCASFAAGWVVAIRHRGEEGRRGAVRRGVVVSLWCLGIYVVLSTAVWLVV
jgi:hypothetical protein